jgi:GDP-4-dehydro-6-deoxy-D-mannose reductase
MATIVGTDVCAESSAPVDAYVRCDLTVRSDVDRLVSAAQPDVVFHLAGLFRATDDEEIIRVNVGGFVCLRDSLSALARANGKFIRMVTVGSAAELGSRGAAQLPVFEDADCTPESAYGRSKWEVTRLAQSEPSQAPLQIVIARTFNLVGPGLSPSLSLGYFARQIASVVRGETKAVHCGPLETRRDFVDVRDASAAYVALAEKGRVGQVYNVCAGRSYRMGRLLDILMTLANVKPKVVCESARPRPGDLKDIYGDHGKITREVGWEPTIDIERSLADLLSAA